LTTDFDVHGLLKTSIFNVIGEVRGGVYLRFTVLIAPALTILVCFLNIILILALSFEGVDRNFHTTLHLLLVLGDLIVASLEQE